MELLPCDPGFPVSAPHRVIASPRPLGDRPVVVVDAAWPEQTRLRLQLLRSSPTRVRAFTGTPAAPGLLAALVVAGTIPVAGLESPGNAELPGVVEHLASLEGPLAGLERAADLAVLRQPADLVVLRRTSRGGLIAELLAVAFPSGWSPAARVGATLSELHAPVADNARLQAAAPALSEALLTKGPFLQHVWGLQPDDALSRDPSAPGWPPTPDPDGRWWLRIERQTTWPLPSLERALFWIRPTLTPLAALTVSQRATLAAAVDSMSPSARAYKGLGGDRLGGDRLAAFRSALADLA